MKVMNLLEEDFDASCNELATLVTKKFIPDVIIGVLTGGGVVGRNIYSSIRKKNPEVIYEEVLIQRMGTRIKHEFGLKKYLRMLPQSILNILRNLEVEFLELKAKFIKPKRHGLKPMSDSMLQLLNDRDIKILIVDDCVDTGATLNVILDYIKTTNNRNHIVKTAVFTIAHRKPIVEPDFTMYRRVLIRFPWACDAKTKE